MQMNTSATHTPGPWRIESRLGGFDIIGPNNEDLAYVNVSDGLDEPTIYPCKANANLIAAAPELADAAERAIKIIKANLYHQREKVEDAVSTLEAALARARGE